MSQLRSMSWVILNFHTSCQVRSTSEKIIRRKNGAEFACQSECIPWTISSRFLTLYWFNVFEYRIFPFFFFCFRSRFQFNYYTNGWMSVCACVCTTEWKQLQKLQLHKTDKWNVNKWIDLLSTKALIIVIFYKPLKPFTDSFVSALFFLSFCAVFFRRLWSKADWLSAEYIFAMWNG